MIKKISPLLLLLMISCQSMGKLPGTKIQQETYTALAKERLGDGAVFTANENKTFVLCVNETKGTNSLPNSTTRFFVYDLKGSKITFEQSLSAGYVKWINADEIELYSTPGVMAEGENRDDYTTIYNVISGESKRKSER